MGFEEEKSKYLNKYMPKVTQWKVDPKVAKSTRAALLKV